MSNAFDPELNTPARTTWDRIKRYLSTRSMECWGFFIAGLMIGGAFL